MKYKLLFFIFPFFVTLLFTQCASTKKLSTAENNKATVRKWLEEGWNERKYEIVLAECFASDWRDGNPIRSDQGEGVEGMRETVNIYLSAFPDIHFVITHITADENFVAVRTEITATHLGEAFGSPATQNKLNTSSITIFEMENGKIKVTWQEFDLLGVINQMKG